MAVLAQRTLGEILIMEVDADPNGTVTAPKASLAMGDIAGVARLYQNTDGGTTWVEKT